MVLGDNMIKSAMLLAAGIGSRMAPLTDTCPKPLLKVGKQSQIDYIVNSFSTAGVEKFIVNAWYLSEQVQEHFKGRENVTVIVESERLETGGGVRNALPYLSDVFFVANTDSVIMNADVSILHMQESFDETMDGLLLLVPKANATGYIGGGDFSIMKDGTLVRDSNGGYVFSGVQILRKHVFSNTQEGSFSLNVIYNKLLEQGRLKGTIHKGAWYHISTPNDVEKTNALFMSGAM